MFIDVFVVHIINFHSLNIYNKIYKACFCRNFITCFVWVTKNSKHSSLQFCFTLLVNFWDEFDNFSWMNVHHLIFQVRKICVFFSVKRVFLSDHMNNLILLILSTDIIRKTKNRSHIKYLVFKYLYGNTFATTLFLCQFSFYQLSCWRSILFWTFLRVYLYLFNKYGISSESMR